MSEGVWRRGWRQSDPLGPSFDDILDRTSGQAGTLIVREERISLFGRGSFPRQVVSDRGGAGGAEEDDAFFIAFSVDTKALI